MRQLAEQAAAADGQQDAEDEALGPEGEEAFEDIGDEFDDDEELGIDAEEESGGAGEGDEEAVEEQAQQ